MKRTMFLICALALTVVSVGHAGISVDHDKSVDFSVYSSYVVVEATPPLNPLMRDRLIDALVAVLDEAGLARVEEEPDLEVVVHTSTENEQMITANDWGYGGYRGWYGWRGWGTTTVNVTNVQVGTLMIDIVDTSSQQLVWRGIATDSIPKKSAKLEKRIHKAVENLFRHFPPEN